MATNGTGGSVDGGVIAPTGAGAVILLLLLLVHDVLLLPLLVLVDLLLSLLVLVDVLLLVLVVQLHVQKRTSAGTGRR